MEGKLEDLLPVLHQLGRRTNREAAANPLLCPDSSRLEDLEQWEQEKGEPDARPPRHHFQSAKGAIVDGFD